MDMTERLAYKFRLAHKLNDLYITYFELVRLAQQCGYGVSSYLQAKKDIFILGLSATAQNCDAFTFFSGSSIKIYIKDGLSDWERRFALAHELGHIVMKHTFVGAIAKSKTVDKQEKEADDFALYLLGVPCVVRRKHLSIGQISKLISAPKEYAEKIAVLASDIDDMDKLQKRMCLFCRVSTHKTGRIVYAVMLILLIVCVITIGTMASKLSSTPKANLAAKETAVLQDTGDSVYITASSSFYHREGCAHIIGRGVISVTYEEAVYLGKDPCADCRP